MEQGGRGEMTLFSAPCNLNPFKSFFPTGSLALLAACQHCTAGLVLPWGTADFKYQVYYPSAGISQM